MLMRTGGKAGDPGPGQPGGSLPAVLRLAMGVTQSQQQSGPDRPVMPPSRLQALTSHTGPPLAARRSWGPGPKAQAARNLRD